MRDGFALRFGFAALKIIYKKQKTNYIINKNKKIIGCCYYLSN
jgi:hypothetical protein